MNQKLSSLTDFFVSIKICLVLTGIMAVAGIWAFRSDDVVFALISVRFILCMISFALASFIMLKKKQALFLKCVYLGIVCSFLFQIWTICNYIWSGDDASVRLINVLSGVSLYLFLFTASYGALDSLADDGSRQFMKDRIRGAVASALVTAIWLYKFIKDLNYQTIIVGVVLTLITYICVKHIFINDIKNGFVRALKPYYFGVLLLVISRLVELFLYGDEKMAFAISVLRFVNTMAIIWIFPLAYKGVRKWTLA